MAEQQDKVAWDERRLAAVHAQADKSVRVRRMFDAIAPTYELVNRIASGGRDARWRRRMVELASVRPGDVLLDVACGTGDVMRAFGNGRPAPARIVGADFSAEMLRRAGQRPADHATILQADALYLPLADESADIVSCAFGIRNFQDLDQGLAEMYRVLRPGGRAVILEFTVPRNLVFKRIYLYYFQYVMPTFARLVSRDRSGAYRYLPQSVLSFADRATIIARLESAGFSRVEVSPMSWGIVAIYVARKDADPR